MTCAEFEPFLQPYADGEFSVDERFAFEEHLRRCPPCDSQLKRQTSYKAMMHKAATTNTVVAPDALRNRLSNRLATEQRRQTSSTWVRYAAAAAVVATVSGAYWSSRTSPFLRYVDDAAARHARDWPPEVREASADGIEAWFGGKLDHRVPVPRLGNAVPAGARLSNVQEKPAAYIRYETRMPSGAPPRRFGLFVFSDDQGDLDVAPLPRLVVREARGYRVASWRQGSLVYELVTDMDEPGIREMVTSSTTTTPHLNVQPASLQQ